MAAKDGGLVRESRARLRHAPAWQRELSRIVDLLLPNSNAEARQIARRFKLPLDRLPRGPARSGSAVGLRIPELFRQHAGRRSFVLYVGTIEPRTNSSVFFGP